MNSITVRIPTGKRMKSGSKLLSDLFDIVETAQKDHSKTLEVMYRMEDGYVNFRLEY